jgi:hypothetical protein
LLIYVNHFVIFQHRPTCLLQLPQGRGNQRTFLDWSLSRRGGVPA